MTLVVIFGPAAVGKMTVGMELERLTGMRLNETPRSAPELSPLVSPTPNGAVTPQTKEGRFTNRPLQAVGGLESAPP